LPGKLAPTRETAQAVLDRIVALYQDYAAASEPQGTHRLIGRIRDWETVAHTHAVLGQEVWEIYVTPGWLAYPTMTVDILALTSCHEIGHLVGGFPFKGNALDEDGSASAAESQADYFATKDCLPKLWANERDSNAAAFAELDPSELELCSKAYSDVQSQELCARILITAVQAAQIYHQQFISERKPSVPAPAPELATPDPRIVTKTATGSLDGQCRLDSMVAGIQCDVKESGTTIPGYLPPYGQNSAASEQAARPFACQEGPGARPRCWFYPGTQEFDCTGFESPRCIIENERAGYYTCTTKEGPLFSDCFPYECLTAADGNPSCGP
jgi:hypothetical protein